MSATESSTQKRPINFSQHTKGKAGGRSLQRIHRRKGSWPEEGREVPLNRGKKKKELSAAYLAGFREGYTTVPVPRSAKIEAT